MLWTDDIIVLDTVWVNEGDILLNIGYTVLSVAVLVYSVSVVLVAAEVVVAVVVDSSFAGAEKLVSI